MPQKEATGSSSNSDRGSAAAEGSDSRLAGKSHRPLAQHIASWHTHTRTLDRKAPLNVDRLSTKSSDNNNNNSSRRSNAEVAAAAQQQQQQKLASVACAANVAALHDF